MADLKRLGPASILMMICAHHGHTVSTRTHPITSRGELEKERSVAHMKDIQGICVRSMTAGLQS